MSTRARWIFGLSNLPEGEGYRIGIGIPWPHEIDIPQLEANFSIDLPLLLNFLGCFLNRIEDFFLMRKVLLLFCLCLIRKCLCKDILDMLWNEGQIVAEYVQTDVVSRESMYGQHVAMTNDAKKLIVSAPGSCEVFLYTPISFEANYQNTLGLTIRETVNSALGSNSNLKNHTFQMSQWNGLLLGPVNLPSYAYPPFYIKSSDAAIDDGRNAPNSNPKNTDELNRQRALEENPAMWKRSAAVLRPPTGSPLNSLAECKAANFGGKFHGTTGGNPLSIINYDGLVNIGNNTDPIRVTALAAVGAPDERTGDGAVYVFGQAQSTDRNKLPAGLDIGDGWFYQSKLTNRDKLPANKRAYVGYSVAMAYTAGGSNPGVTLLASGRGLNHVLSFFLSSNGTRSQINSVRGRKSFSWVADPPLTRIVEEKQSDTDRFGDALHISELSRDDGLVAAIGAPNYVGGIGRAYVFRLELNPRRWIQQAELLPEGPNPEPRPGNLFGYSIAISGDHVAVGMCAGTDPKQSAGVVHIFKAQLESGNYTLQDRLTPSVRSGGDDFGCSLAMVRTNTPIANAVGVSNPRESDNIRYKTVVFVGAWNSMASSVGSGAGKARKGAIHTFVTRASNLKRDDGYIWKEGSLIAMFERGGDAYWDDDQQNENNVPSHFGRSIAVSANAKDLIVGHAREDVFSSLPNVYNENPGMML
jgi:hypothetical protein